MTDYVIRTPGQTVADTLITTMILKGLPRHFEQFSIYITHSNKDLFSEFKNQTPQLRGNTKTQRPLTQVVTMSWCQLPYFQKGMKNESCDGCDISCFTCSGKRHLTKICPNNYDRRQKPWCSYCKNTTRKREPSYYKWRDTMKKAVVM